MTDPNPRLMQAPAGRTHLVTHATPPQVLTAVRETDALTAITRGLKEYVETLDVTWVGGRHSKFAKVLDGWAVPEQVAEFPTAILYAQSPGRYDAADFAPRTVQVAGTRSTLRSSSELTVSLSVEVWSTDPKERMAIGALLEDAFDPTDDQTGFVLELPHYHSARAAFSLADVVYADTAINAQQRRRLVVFTLDASVPKYRFTKHVPAFEPRLEAHVDADASVLEDGAPG